MSLRRGRRCRWGQRRASYGSLTLTRRVFVVGETGLAKVRAAAIGFVFQTFNLIPTLCAAENVEAALVPQRLSDAHRDGPRNRTGLAVLGGGVADVGERRLPLPS
jgi:putative ABC transport system ATP-binding protein